jgi:hypothetical protein
MNPQVFGVGVQGRSPAVTAQHRINCYYDIQQEADRTQLAIFARPGLDALCYLGETPIRGMYAVGASLFAAHRNHLYLIRNDGTFSSLGDLDTTEGTVYFAHGHLNGSGAQYLMCVDGTSGYTYELVAGTFAKITDDWLPANPTSVTYSNQYFIVNWGGTGQFFISDQDDPRTGSALDFSTASTRPDALLRVFAYQGVLGLFGEDSTEYWGFTGASAFPFERVYGSVQNWGLAAPASLVPFGDAGIALCKNTLGQSVVCLITTAGNQEITPADLVHRWNVPGFLNTDAVGAAFMEAGHMQYLLTFPTEQESWLFDRSTGAWSIYQSGTEGGAFLGMHAAHANNRLHFGGRTDGTIYRTNPDTYTDDGAEFPVELVSRDIYTDNSMQTCSEFYLDMEEGVGTTSGDGSAPVAMLQVSKDKGRTWGAERTAHIGALGKHQTRVRWLRMGSARSFKFKVRITDPVKRVITGERVMIRNGAA